MAGWRYYVQYSVYLTILGTEYSLIGILKYQGLYFIKLYSCCRYMLTFWSMCTYHVVYIRFSLSYTLPLLCPKSTMFYISDSVWATLSPCYVQSLPCFIYQIQFELHSPPVMSKVYMKSCIPLVQALVYISHASDFNASVKI